VSNAAGGFGYFIWWVLLIIASAFIGNKWVWLAVLTAPITLFIGMFWWEAFRSFISHSRFLLLKWRKSQIIDELQKLRSSISFWGK
jgi:hypothetical protein